MTVIPLHSGESKAAALLRFARERGIDVTAIERPVFQPVGYAGPVVSIEGGYRRRQGLSWDDELPIDLGEVI
jgi:hypothetical protein